MDSRGVRGGFGKGLGFKDLVKGAGFWIKGLVLG